MTESLYPKHASAPVPDLVLRQRNDELERLVRDFNETRGIVTRALSEVGKPFWGRGHFVG